MELTQQERRSIIIGMLGLITTFGIARFIYTPLLPLMQAELGFGDDWAGMLAAVNCDAALITAYLVQAVGIVLPVFSTSEAAAPLGALLFGGTFMGIVAMVLMYGGRLAGSRPTPLIGVLTACFGLAQIN